MRMMANPTRISRVFSQVKATTTMARTQKTISATTARKKDTQKPTVMPRKEKKERISNRATMMLC
jgi:hypothetical protein